MSQQLHASAHIITRLPAYDHAAFRTELQNIARAARIERVARVRRAEFIAAVSWSMLASMPSTSLARTQPAAAPHDVERERNALARALADRWPRAVGSVLRLAAQVDRHNRRAVAIGLAPLVADPPLAAADALWAAIGASDAGERRGRR